jgi:hypothetical protein
MLRRLMWLPKGGQTMKNLTHSNRLFGPAVALLLVPCTARAIEWSFQPRLELGYQLYEFKQGTVTETKDVPAFKSNTASIYDFSTNTITVTICTLSQQECADNDFFEYVTFTEGESSTQSVTTSSRKFDDQLWTLSGGFTVFADRFFLDISAQGAFDGSDSDDITGTFSLPTTAFQTGESQVSNGITNADFDREEYALSFGYAVTEHFSIYAGWKKSVTKFEEKRTGTYELTSQFYNTLGVVNADGEFVPVTDPRSIWVGFEGSFTDKVEYDFDQDGPFLGAAYGWRFDGDGLLKGSLTANFAVAFLDGEFKDVKRTPVDSTLDSTTLNGQEIPVVPGAESAFTDYATSTIDDQAVLPFFDGSTIGATFGVTWGGETNVEGLSYLLGVNAYSYNFDADNSSGVSGGDVSETVVNFRAGIAYLF